MDTLLTPSRFIAYRYDSGDYRIAENDGTVTRHYLREGEHLEAITDTTDEIEWPYLRDSHSAAMRFSSRFSDTGTAVFSS